MAFRDKFRQIFFINDTPHRIALAFAVGIFMGIAPLIGLHIVGTLALAWILRLNKLVTFAGACVLNPWTIVPIYSFSLWFGAKLMGIKHLIPNIDWNNITLTSFIKELGSLILPFIVGTFALGAISALISYFIIRNIVSRYRTKDSHAA